MNIIAKIYSLFEAPTLETLQHDLMVVQAEIDSIRGMMSYLKSFPATYPERVVQLERKKASLSAKINAMSPTTDVEED